MGDSITLQRHLSGHKPGIKSSSTANHGFKVTNYRFLWILWSSWLIRLIRRFNITQIAKYMGPTWGPPGSCRPQMGPMLASWTLLSGNIVSDLQIFKFEMTKRFYKSIIFCTQNKIVLHLNWTLLPFCGKDQDIKTNVRMSMAYT